jgi:hypothetical protein
MISSDVLEHVQPPVHLAFEGTHQTLKDGGWLILTVPYMNSLEHTIEHFPELYDYEFLEVEQGKYILRNITLSGDEQLYQNLRFHGGPGMSLEMRVFSQSDLLRHLEEADFSSFRIASEDVPELGIVWNTEDSLPLVCRK